MLRDDKRFMVNFGRHGANHTAIPRSHAMIDICFRQVLLQQIEQGQQHGANGPEKIRKGQITVFFNIDPLNDVKEITGHKYIQ